MLPPPRSTDEQLHFERDLSEKLFIADRQGEGPNTYYSMWEAVEPLVRSAMQTTDGLSKINPVDLVKDKSLWQILRYICAPRVSEEDLWTLVGKKFKNVPQAAAGQTAKVLTDLVDMKRFPWVVAKRSAHPQEFEAAVLATVTLLTHEQLGTRRRGAASKNQEEQVSEALLSAGLKLDKSRRSIAVLDELERGHFSRERKVGTSKCDIPIRLFDGRLLALECKVSNGPKNSWKRLQREVGGKADNWRGAFGNLVVTGAVLAGVFDLKCLSDAQNKQNVTLFWQHNLKPLIEFVKL